MIIEDSDSDVMVLMTFDELCEQIKTDFKELKQGLIEYHKTY